MAYKNIENQYEERKKAGEQSIKVPPASVIGFVNEVPKVGCRMYVHTQRQTRHSSAVIDVVPLDDTNTIFTVATASGSIYLVTVV